MANGGSITWRFGMDGAAGVRSDLKSVGEVGAAAAAQTGDAWSTTGGVADQVAARYRALAEQIQRTAAQAAATPIQQRINLTTDARSGNSAQASADVYAQQFAAAAKLRDAINPVAVAQRTLATETGRVNDLFKAGLITEAEHAAGMKLAESTYKSATSALHEVGGASSGVTRELIVLGREASRGNFSRMGGSATILAQRLGLLEAALSPVGLVIITLTAITIGAAIAEERWAASQQRIVAALQGTAAASGATVEEINEIGASASKAGGLSEAAGRQFALAFASAGVSAGNLKEATAIVRDFAVATGQDATKAQGELAKAFADPAKGAVELNNDLHFLTQAQIDQITKMQEQGDKAGALKLLMDQLSTATVNAAQHQTELGKSMHEVAGWFSNAADAIGQYISKTLDLPEADAKARQSQLLKQKADLVAGGSAAFIGGEGGMQAGQAAKAYAAAVADVDAKLTDNAKIVDQQAQRTKQAAASVASTNLRAASDDLDPQSVQIAKKRAEIDQERKALKNPALLKDSGESAEQAEKRIAMGEREIAQLEQKEQHLDKHAAALARDSDAETKNAAAALIAAAAYARGGDAVGGAAESRQKAEADATRRGIPVEPEVARQQQLDAANAAKTGEQNAAQLRDETTALLARNAAVLAGSASFKDATRAMEDQAKLHPLLIRQDQGDAAARAAVKKAIEDETGALIANHAAQDQGEISQAISEQQDKLAELQRQAQLAALPKGSRVHDDTESTLAAQAELRSRYNVKDFTSPEAQTYIANAVQEGGIQKSTAATQYGTDTLKSQQEATAVLQEQIALMGKGAAEQDLVLGQLKQENELRDHNVSASSAQGQAILAATANQIRLNAALKLGQDSEAELQHTGDQLIDSLGSGLGNLQNGWGAFADAGMSAMRDLEAEMIKLALLNPLKNSLGLDGGNLPTLGSAWNTFWNGGGGGFSAPITGNIPQGFGAPSVDPISWLPGNAGGTSDFGGGLTWINEDGPELVRLPAHTQIYNNNRTMAMAGAVSPTAQGATAGSGGGDVHLHNNTGQPMQATKSTSANGDLLVQLTPLMRQGIMGASQDGTLQRAVRMMPDNRTTRA